MSKYLRNFQSHSDYDTYINGQDKLLPNVSYCKNENEVHYNPWVETRVIGIFNVIDDTQKTTIMSLSGNWISNVEVDGINYNVEDTDEGKLQLSLGTHTVKYTLKNPTAFGGEIDGVLYGCTSLTNVTIPNTVTSIGQFAFAECTGLTSITIPSSVTNIGEGAFGGCSGLTSIVVDSGNTVYDSRNDCNAIIETSSNTLIAGCNNTVIPNSVTTIGDTAFSGRTGLTSITIPDSVTTIGFSAFSYCTGLTSVTIPNSITIIDEGAFSYCTGLTSVTIGSGVTTIAPAAFESCSNLTSITSLATTAPTITIWTFLRVKTGGTLYVPSGSTGYNVWMGTSANYLGYYNWTKVEQ